MCFGKLFTLNCIVNIYLNTVNIYLTTLLRIHLDILCKYSMQRRVFNLERDVRRTDWVVDKICRKEIYAQNFYAALCNNNFAPKDMWSLLKNLTWSCTWRYAADMVSDIRHDDSYSYWYCSGTGFSGTDFVGFVEESYITEEIQEDLDQLGWMILYNQPIDC